MPSDYAKWLQKDIKPDHKPQKKPSVWTRLRYDWGIILAIIVVISIIVEGVIGHFKIGQTIPDYQFAYVGENALPDDTVNAFCSLIESIGEDLNGDGKVVVTLNQYPTASQNATVSKTKLLADIESNESYFFLMDDPEQFQKDYHILAAKDGSEPDENDCTTEGKVYAWTNCLVLSSHDLGAYTEKVLGETASGSSDDLMKNLYLGRRYFYSDKAVQYQDGCNQLWETIVKGAVQ